MGKATKFIRSNKAAIGVGVLGLAITTLSAKPGIILPTHERVLESVRAVRPEARKIGKKWETLKEPLQELSSVEKKLKKCKRKGRYTRGRVKRACTRQRKKAEKLRRQKENLELETGSFCYEFRNRVKGESGSVMVEPTDEERKAINEILRKIFESANCGFDGSVSVSYPDSDARDKENLIRVLGIMLGLGTLLTSAYLFLRRKDGVGGGNDDDPDNPFGQMIDTDDLPL